MVFQVKWRFESSKYPSFEPRKIFKCEYIECLNDNLPMLKKKNFSITSDSKPLGSFKKKHTHTHKMFRLKRQLEKIFFSKQSVGVSI